MNYLRFATNRQVQNTNCLSGYQYTHGVTHNNDTKIGISLQTTILQRTRAAGGMNLTRVGGGSLSSSFSTPFGAHGFSDPPTLLYTYRYRVVRDPAASGTSERFGSRDRSEQHACRLPRRRLGMDQSSQPDSQGDGKCLDGQ